MTSRTAPMKPIVAIIAQGSMAAGLAARLHRHGVEVRTNLSGRSPESRSRAAAAGMRAVDMPELLEADILLSVLPPAAALPLAQALAPQLAAAPRKPLFVDCNAVSPAAAGAIARLIEASGTGFVDAGIIGLPPREGDAGPRLYAAGARARELLQLCEFGLQIRVLEGQVGAASALKMAFAGISKGLTAVATGMILAAARAGLAGALAEELSQSEPTLHASLARRIPDMLPKAYRWIDEMRQIAEFAQADPATAALFEGAALLYQRIATDAATDRREAAALLGFFNEAGG